ncbi:hypothetical protein KKB43_04705 [Patescibacteria group bacterium]|nr:hypothetical protein [Patescibacteria group bacterium]
MGRYTACAIGASVQAISAAALATAGLIQLTPSQQVLAGVGWIFIASILYFGDK